MAAGSLNGDAAPISLGAVAATSPADVPTREQDAPLTPEEIEKQSTELEAVNSKMLKMILAVSSLITFNERKHAENEQLLRTLCSMQGSKMHCIADMIEEHARSEVESQRMLKVQDEIRHALQQVMEKREKRNARTTVPPQGNDSQSESRVVTPQKLPQEKVETSKAYEIVKEKSRRRRRRARPEMATL
jgi:hypothetical protein